MSDVSPASEPVFAVYQGDDVMLLDAIDSESLGPVDCLVGHAIALGKQDWRSGLKIRIPVPSITRIIEYESLEHHRDILANHYAQMAVDQGG